MNPLKVKATGSPITSANISGLQTMTDAEVKNYIANVITEKFASVTDGTGTAEINITTNNSGAGTSIGTFVDTTRNESIGTHPATGAVSTTTYYVKQVTAAATENITNKPLAWDSRLEEMTDGDIDSTMDLCIDAMVAESSYTAGQYKLQPTAPSGGTWVARYTLTDTAQGGNTVTYLWQKTVASSAPTVDYTPLKLFDGGNCKQMTEAEIEQMLPVFRNRIIETGIGTYKIQTDAPSGGTWIQTGNTFTDTREEVIPQNYAGNFVGNFSGNFTGFYTGNYAGVVNYSGNYSGTYSTFTGFATAYSGVYSGTAPYSGIFSGAGNYSGNYAGTAPYSGVYSGPANFGGISFNPPIAYSGAYAGNYAGSRNYAGTYTSTVPGSNYTGYYSGSRNYAGNYASNFSSSGPSYTGYYAGPVSYTGQYSGTMSFTGQYSGGVEPGTFQYYTGYFSGIIPGGNFIGYYTDGTQVLTTYTGVRQGPPLAPGEPGDTYVGYFDGLGPAYYAGYYTGGPTPTTYSQGFLGPAPAGPSYTGFYAGPVFYAGYYLGPAGPIGFGGNYAAGNEPSPVFYAGYYTAPNVNYTGFFSGSRTYSGNYEGTYLGSPTSVFFSGSRTYSGTYLGYYTGSYSGSGGTSPANYTGVANYTGFYTGPANYSGNYTGPGIAYTGFFTGPANYSGNYSADGTILNFVGNYAGNYASGVNYSGTYSGSYLNNFSGTFSGNYSGATIQASKETVSSVKLWLRTA